eukprot:6102100-Pleurochrysis_carterae.AAC.1
MARCVLKRIWCSAVHTAGALEATGTRGVDVRVALRADPVARTCIRREVVACEQAKAPQRRASA